MTSIFDIAGVVPTQTQQERIADEDLAMSMPLGRRVETDNQLLSRLAYQRGAQVGRGFGVTPPQPTLAQSQQQAYDKYRVPDRVMMTPVSPAYNFLSSVKANPHLSTFGDTRLRDEIIQGLSVGGRPVYGTGVHKGQIMGVRDVPSLLGFGSTYTGFSKYDPYANAMRGHVSADIEREPKVVLPEYDATANAKRCPDGYIFDEQLQACRLATSLPNQPEPTAYDFYEVPYEDAGLLGGYGADLFYG